MVARVLHTSKSSSTNSPALIPAIITPIVRFGLQAWNDIIISTIKLIGRAIERIDIFIAGSELTGFISGLLLDPVLF